jgi:DNA-binding beta-propeller fold protein YncE
MGIALGAICPLSVRAQNATTTVSVGGNPSGIVVNPVTNKIYVEIGGDNVAVIDGATNLSTTIAAGSAGSLAVNPVTDKIYVSNGPFSGIVSPPHVTVIDGASNSTAIIAAGSAGAITVNPVTNTVYVANSNNVTTIDGTTNATTLYGGGSVGYAAVNPATDRVYIADQHTIEMKDNRTNDEIVATSLGGGPMAVNSTTNKIYLADLGSNFVTEIDGATNAATAISLGADTGPIAVNPVTNKVYVLTGGGVTVIDGATLATATIPLGSNPQAIQVNPVTNEIYVLTATNVTVIDGLTNETHTVAVGSAPQGIAVNPVTNKVYVANNGSADVTVIDGSQTGSAPPSARLINLSVRAQVGTAGNILIPGFVIAGGGTETLLVRGVGPGLAQFGVPGSLAQPSLIVLDGTGRIVASNTGWGTNSDPAQIARVAAQAGAFGFSPGSADCAVIVTLPAGAYTAQISGVDGTTGVALAEVYEVSHGETRLVNMSTRAQVGSGANVIIPGFVISGSGADALLVRADGPALTGFGVTGVLADPSLSIFDSSGTAIASNTGWTSADLGLISGFDATVGAFSLAPGSADSAQVVSLPQGTYTMRVSGVNDATGVALAEIYEAP